MKRLLIFPQLFMLLFIPIVKAADTPNLEVAHKILRDKGCITCHLVPGFPQTAQAKIGPPLGGIAKRRRIVGGLLKNTPKNMRKWLKSPSTVKNTMMPNAALTDTEIEILIEFLSSLK